MTIQSLPIATNPTVNNSSVGIAVMAKSLDNAQQSGDNLIKMMEQSVNPSLGQNIDMKI